MGLETSHAAKTGLAAWLSVTWCPSNRVNSTPAQHHFGHTDAVIDARQRVMEEAMAVNPARFTVPCVIRAPKPQVWINQLPDKETDTTQ